VSGGYLLDTNVISMLFPSRMTAGPEFISWLQAQNDKDTLFISVVTIQEIEKGAEKLASRKDGNPARAALIRGWLEGLLSAYDDHILSVDLNVAMASGRVEGVALAKGYDPGLADTLIAATAEIHALTILTNNIKDFRPLGIAAKTPAEIIA
jgi:predicted nucleic acid-binding protein